MWLQQHTADETQRTKLSIQVSKASITISAIYGYKIRQSNMLAAYTNSSPPKLIVAWLLDGFEKEGKY